MTDRLLEGLSAEARLVFSDPRYFAYVVAVARLSASRDELEHHLGLFSGAGRHSSYQSLPTRRFSVVADTLEVLHPDTKPLSVFRRAHRELFHRVQSIEDVSA
jgi:hypothetical protein